MKKCLLKLGLRTKLEKAIKWKFWNKVEFCSFSKAGSWEKDIENGAPAISLGPSYFVTALLYK